ncbi:MAG: hypothetical protein WBD31_27130 [Rubripirellula sp.]|nr:hypothetical protein [Rubripirellula tenax]
MKNFRLSLIALLLLLAIQTRSDADVIIAFDSAGAAESSIRQAANQKLNFFVSSNAADRVLGIEIGFLFPSATLVTASDIGTTSSEDRGFYADTNLSTSSLFVFPFEGDTEVFVDQELTNVQALGVTPQRWFELTIDASALAIGDYVITLDPSTPGFNTDQIDPQTRLPVPIALANTTFNLSVTAVPEPSTTSFFAITGLALIWCVRRRIPDRTKQRCKCSVS